MKKYLLQVSFILLFFLIPKVTFGASIFPGNFYITASSTYAGGSYLITFPDLNPNSLNSFNYQTYDGVYSAGTGQGGGASSFYRNWFSLGTQSNFPTNGWVCFNGSMGGSGTLYPSSSCASSSNYYIQFKNSGILIPNTPTYVISTTPTNATTAATSTNFTVGYSAYINPNDSLNLPTIKFTVQNGALNYKNLLCADAYCAYDSVANPGLNLQYSQTATTSGTISYSTTTPMLQIGTYNIKISITSGSYCLFGSCLTTTLLASTSTSFVVGTTTQNDLIQQNINSTVNTLLNTASTTSIQSDCAITNLNFYNCGIDLIIFGFAPSQAETDSFVTQIKTNIITHFPLGYITDFANIISTSSTSTLTVIDATIPPGIPGSGAKIHLDMSHAVDFILNATTSQFNSQGATSTQTFYQITEYYWEILINLGILLYIIARIIGIQAHGVSHKVDNQPKK